MSNIRAKLFLTMIAFLIAIAGYAWFYWMPHTTHLMISESHQGAAPEDVLRNETQDLLIVILAALSSFFILAGLLVYRSILRPAIQLSRAAKAMAGGDYTIDLPQSRNDEMGILISRFEKMRTQIRNFTADILEQKELAEKEVSERKRIESQMQEYADKLELLRFDADDARKKAEAASEAKTQFLANMSHELRTPMNGIIGLTSLLQDADMKEEDKEALRSIHSSADGLLDLLNDILDFSKIEAGELSLEYTPMNVRQCIEQVFDVMKPLASRKRLVLDLTYSPVAPHRIIGDANRVRQILYNLVGNAIKFTEEGSIRVDVSNYTPESGGSGLCFRVEDTGIGVPEEVKEKIFEKFTQADISTARKFGGTGLGLAITKQLIEMMNGEIGVESVENRGSTFWFKIPAERVTDEERANQKAYEQAQEEDRNMDQNETLSFADHNALVVDDHPVNILFAQKLMKKMGFDEVKTAHHGRIALDLFCEEKFDIVIMDCQMPEMDGYEATRAIRKWEAENPERGKTPVIAITADAIKGAREQCLEAGMDDYLTKPIDQAKLHKVLCNALALTPAQDNNDAAANENTRAEQQQYNAVPPIDLDHLELFTEGDPQEEENLLTLFFEQTDLGLAALEEHCNDTDDEEWKKAAHRMKGAAANLGAVPLSEACKAAEFAFEQSTNEKKILLDDIRHHVKTLRAFLDQRASAA